MISSEGVAAWWSTDQNTHRNEINRSFFIPAESPMAALQPGEDHLLADLLLLHHKLAHDRHEPRAPHSAKALRKCQLLFFRLAKIKYSSAHLTAMCACMHMGKNPAPHPGVIVPLAARRRVRSSFGVWKR